MDEKIAMLRNELPDSLVENKKLYGILSKGVHELDEQECLDAFPVAKLGIELILDENLAAKERAGKLKACKKSIDQLAAKMK